MKHNTLYKAIVLSMGIAGAVGIAHADDQPITGSGASINLGEIKVTAGGFIEGAIIERNRNQDADVASKFQSLPLPNTDQYHTSEYRMSGRQSRVSLLAQGPVRDGAKAEAYYEADFLGVGTASNSTQSNSYVLRVRQAFADYTKDSGFQILAGQAWSLITQNKNGINARGENVPLTIDAQYVAGFNWTRNAQLRLTDKFSDMVSGAVSFESPQAVPGGAKPGNVGTIVTGEAGGSLLNSAATSCSSGTVTPSSGTATTTATNCTQQQYTTDPLPDVIAKVAIDPGYGHYEVLGMSRHFRDRVDTGSVVANGSNDTAQATSFGANALLPIVPKVLDFQASYLGGNGIGRYGTSTLTDYTYKADGTPKALKGADYMVGLVAHPDKQWDLYAYVGQEKVDSSTDTSNGLTQNVGYGGSLTSSGSACNGTTSYNCDLQKVSEITAGFWYKFYQGSADHMQVGLQYGHLTDTYFADASGAAAKVSMNEVMASFRYYPFSK